MHRGSNKVPPIYFTVAVNVPGIGVSGVWAIIEQCKDRQRRRPPGLGGRRRVGSECWIRTPMLGSPVTTAQALTARRFRSFHRERARQQRVGVALAVAWQTKTYAKALPSVGQRDLQPTRSGPVIGTGCRPPAPTTSAVEPRTSHSAASSAPPLRARLLPLTTDATLNCIRPTQDMGWTLGLPPVVIDSLVGRSWPLSTWAIQMAAKHRACSLVGAGAGLSWLVLVFLEENTVGWLVWAG